MLDSRRPAPPLVEILQIAPLPQSVELSLAERFYVHKLWLTNDEDAFLASCAPNVQGFASGGHRPIDLALMDKFPRLEIVASFGVGYDHIDAAGAAERGVVVTHTPDVLSDEVADLAVGLLIATVRKLPQADIFVRAGRWATQSFPLSRSLRGRKVGILGLGRIAFLDSASTSHIMGGLGRRVSTFRIIPVFARLQRRLIF